MTADRLSHRRRSIRLATHDYSSPGAYFIILCTQNRERLFGEIIDDEMRPNEFGRIVQTAWGELPRYHPDAEFDAFVVMPNHVHGIVVIQANGVVEANPVGPDDDRAFVGAVHEPPLQANAEERIDVVGGDPQRHLRMLLPRIIGRLKMTTAKSINLARGTPGAAVWQRGFYEHIVRDESRLLRIRSYILANPSR